MTEKPKHTPGPWFSSPLDISEKDWESWHSDDMSVIRVHGAPEGYEDSPVDGQALAVVFTDDARLIAAAPEMYALLEQVVNAFEDTEKSWANFEEQMMFFCVDAQELIEKIKGE